MRKIIQVFQFIELKNNIILISLLIVLIIAGIAYSFYLGDIFRYGDESQYYTLAQNLISTHQYTLDGANPTAFRSPGYPLILSVFLLYNASVPFLRIINFLALSLCAFFLYKLVKKKSTPIGGLIAVFILMGYPVLFYTAGTLYPQIIGSLFLLIVLFLVTQKESEKLTNSNFFLAGVMYGCLVLTVPGFLLNLPIFSLSPWFFKAKKKLLASIIFFFSAILVVSLWTARNYIVFDKLVPLTSHSGITFLAGNSEGARSTSYNDVDTSKYREELKKLDEIDKNKFLFNKSLEWIKNNKTKAVKLYVVKVINYFNYRVELKEESQASTLKDIIMLLTFGPILMLLIIRIFLIKKVKPDIFEKFLMLLYFSNAFLLALVIIRIRLRLPFDFLLIAVVAIFLDKMRKQYLLREKKPPLL